MNIYVLIYCSGYDCGQQFMAAYATLQEAEARLAIQQNRELKHNKENWSIDEYTLGDWNWGED